MIAKPPRRDPAELFKENTHVDARKSQQPTASPKSPRRVSNDLRKRIGVKITDTLEPWNYEATRDAIRHYAHGIGDDNPLWTDPAYAEKTKYGTIVALPSFLFSTNRIVSGYCGGLSGIHAMWAGADWTWHKPVLRNDVITTEAYLKDLIEHQTRFAGRSLPADLPRGFLQPARRQGGGVPIPGCSAPIATKLASAARSTRKLAAVSSRYTEEQLAEFYKVYEAEKIRGATPRYWEDVKEGEALPAHDERPDDGHRLHLLRAGLGRSLHPRQQARLEDAVEAPGLGHQESLQRA